MRVPRVFVDLPLCEHSELTLPPETAHYLLTVLRLGAGRPLTLFDGRGQEFAAELLQGSRKNAVVAVASAHTPATESPLATTVALGVSRGERMDWALQKLTELGVHRIVPLFTERAEVKLSGDRLGKRLQHWSRILVSAAEQSGRVRVPELAEPQSLSDYLAHWAATAPPAAEHCALVLDPTANARLQSMPPPAQVSLLVGPEGGLAGDEVHRAVGAGFTPMGLGPRVLRTETAPVAALAAVQTLWGDA